MISKMTRFEGLLEAVPGAVVGTDQQGVIWFVNAQTESLFGRDRHELVGGPIERLIPENLGRIGEERCDGYFADLSTRSGGIELELIGRHRDGTDLPVSVTVSRVSTGDALLVITAVGNVTRQRQAFEAAQQMAAIVESSDDAIIGRTLKGIVTSWNPAAERMYGYSSAEIVGKSIDRLIPEDRLAEVGAAVAKLTHGQHVERLDTVRVRKDGTVIPVSVTVSPIRDADGAIVGISVIHSDMSELEHAARYARSLIEAGLDPLVTVSPGGKITDVNEATVTVTGVPRHELIGSDFAQYVTDPGKAQEGYERAFKEGSLTDFPLTVLHRDGTLTEVLTNASVYRDLNGTVLGVLAVARDATMLRAQQQLSGQLQEALASRIVIEQAKGITAQRNGISIDQAYQHIRAHARSNHASLRAVAQAIVDVGLQV